MIIGILIFGIFNFGALGLGVHFMGQGATSVWYHNLDKAPWTPPGWVFGVAWITVMICFSIYMAELWIQSEDIATVFSLFGLQWVLNVLWNPSFFKYRLVLIGLTIIIMLTLVVLKLFISYWSLLSLKSIWILPYLIWLLIATSLNTYIYIKN